jgi:hypothetical protein
LSDSLPRAHRLTNADIDRVQAGQNESVTTIQIEDQYVSVASEASGIGNLARSGRNYLRA